MEFSVNKAVINKPLESRWRPSGSRDSDGQSWVRHWLRQLILYMALVAAILQLTCI